MIGEVHLCDHRELAARLTAAGQMVDLLATDCPYSSAVHAGHDSVRHLDGTAESRSYDGAERREIDYAHWTPADVDAFVATWEPLTRGWFCAMADDELALSWKAALRNTGRLVFPLIPCTERGATVRLAGEGPSSCTTFLIVARPRTAEGMATALSLAYDSHYVGPREKKPVVGGKPIWLTRRIVGHYSKPDDIVCDPCAGGGAFPIAAKMSGRRFVASDINAEHVEIARDLLSRTVPSDFRGIPTGGARGKSLPLFGGGT